jgi:hypothetical protein
MLPQRAMHRPQKPGTFVSVVVLIVRFPSSQIHLAPMRPGERPLSAEK